MTRGIARLLVLAGLLSMVFALGAEARLRTKRLFVEAYPKTKGTKLDDCVTCHESLPPAPLNPYGSALLRANLAFKAIEKSDADKDGVTNGAEIAALSYPGDPKDRPGARRDTVRADSARADTAKVDSSGILPDSTRRK